MPRIRIVALLAITIALVAGACGPTSTSSPSASQSLAPMTEPPLVPTPEPGASGEPAGSPVPAPTEAPATAAPTIPGGSAGPDASVTPAVDTLKVKRTADCLGTNGTSTTGYIKLTWTSSGTTGVRISIDPPGDFADAYDYGYADYPASGSAEVPFSCDPPNHDANGDYHLYVVTTIHQKGYYAWRFARVYQVTPAP